MTLRFGSVCSGIEAASVAWHPLGWTAAWFSEIEPFPCALLRHHYPNTPNHGDMTLLPARVRAGEVEAPDLLCGGTPCQAFSVAGLRRSLSDERGNLSLVFCELADAIDDVRAARGEEPCLVFWENVPGVLNTDDNAFGCLLGALAGEDGALEPPGGRWTDAGCVHGPRRSIGWRVLDAQYFGLAQQRPRVFLVASARTDRFDPTEVLFEREGVCWVPEKAGNKTPFAGAASSVDGAGLWCADVCGTLTDGAHNGGGLNGQDVYTGRILVQGNRPRRLTPVECERLMGFEDNYTRIEFRPRGDELCPDGLRFEALANSWPVNVVRWLGERIQRELTRD